MNAQQEILNAFAEGYHPTRPLGAMLSAFKAEVLREAAERIRQAHPMLLVRHPESPNAVALAMQSAMADLIDPDKERSADGTEAGRP